MYKHEKKGRKSSFFKGLCYALVFSLIVTMCPPLTGAFSYAETSSSALTIEQPEILVTGTGVIGGDAYTKSNVGYEKAYTRDELKAMKGGKDVVYSSIKSQDPWLKEQNTATGVYVSSLLEDTAFDASEDKLTIIATDDYSISFDPDAEYKQGQRNTTGFGEKRFSFPGLLSGDNAGPVEVETMIAWAWNEDSKSTPATAGDEQKNLRVVAGQLNFEDQNKPLFNGGKVNLETVLADKPITGTALTVGSDTYTRGDVLLMARAEKSYTYDSSSGTKTDYAQGVPMSVLLADYDEDCVVTFAAADGYPVKASGMTVKELIDNNFILAYAKGSSADDMSAIYTSGDNGEVAYFTLYGDGTNGKPAKMVDTITVTEASGIDFAKSPYKHITNGGLTGQDGPFDIDAITGATLTIEGPGVKTSVPLSVRDLEGKNAGAFRGVYTDVRNGEETVRTYEGIDLYYILHNMSTGDNGIQLTETAKKVLIKNRNRNTVATFTMDQVTALHEAGKPILVAYGTAFEDGSSPSPFVFDNQAGANDELGNEDGCLKLVYDKSAITGDLNADYTEFANMAYIYVAEESTPGFKHDKAPYDTAENSAYVVTITGDGVGREVNYTVGELEDMVVYDAEGKPVAGGIGHRDEYSLANSNYWYVNEYEGVKLWDLLLKSGIKANQSEDDETIVSFSATDGYTVFDKFSLKQIADPDSFGYYEKNAADNNDGNYKGQPSDLIDTGYPVLVAYGVNGYPYVINNKLAGYLSGLSNDGGPLRIISGKTEYSHANGSQQAKLLDKIIVGDDTYHYSTHKYHDNKVYNDIADQTLNVKVMNGSGESATEMKAVNYKVGDIEELIYGGKLTKAQLAEAKIKGFYEAIKNGNGYSDLYEGINLNYFLKNVVELPGEKGTITFTDASGNSTSYNLEELLKLNDGYNTTTKLSGLSPVLAYAKNGAPMVATNEDAGYESSVTLGEGDHATKHTIKNDGGPLSVMIPNSSETAKDGKQLKNIVSITINLSPDNYAHIKAPYDTYADNTLTISGEGTRIDGEEVIKLSDLEGKQTIAETGVYSILKSADGEASQQKFRGINLYKLLQSYGLKPNADKVVVICSDGTKKEFTVEEVRKSDYVNSVTGDADLSMILAYGSAAADNPDDEDGLPLVGVDPVTGEDADGYNSAYGNNGGPLKLVVGQVDAKTPNGGKSGSILKDVVSIEVTASEMVSWNHSTSAIFSQYLNNTLKLQVVDDAGNTLFDKDYTVAQIEGMTDFVERETITTTGTNTWEGINLWKFISKETADVPGMDNLITLQAFAEDGVNKDLLSIFGKDVLQNGIKDGEQRIPIILAYAVDGYPLASGGKNETPGEGYDSTIGNNGGPLRLVTHGNQGASLQETNKIVIKVSSTGGVTQTEKFETIATDNIANGLPVTGIRSVQFDKEGGMWIGTYGGGAMYKAAGAENFTIYNKTSTPALETGYVSALAIDADGGVWMSQNASYTNPTENKGVVYMKDGKVTSYTVEGNPGTIPDNYVQDIKIDKDGNVWFASFGGLTKYDPAKSEWTTWDKEDGFPAASVTRIEFDGNGGMWLGFYPDGDGKNTAFTGGYAHMSADGKITPYNLTASFDETSGQYRLAEVWVRDIAVDAEGGAWIIASGANIENVGGSVWYVSEPGAEAKSYTGDQLFGKALDGGNNAEVRMVAVDHNGGLWFGTSADGIFYVADPAIGEDGAMTITTMYSTETGSWTAKNMNNVYSLDIYGGTVYAGTSAGVAYASLPQLKVTVGDANESTAEFSVTGDGVENNGYFTIRGLKNASGVEKVSQATYKHTNSSGTNGETKFDGITVESILGLVGVKEGAAKVTFIAKDGFSKTIDIEDVYTAGIDGNKTIVALTEYAADGTSAKVTKSVVAKKSEEHINKSLWVDGLVKIVVETDAGQTPDNPPVTPEDPTPENPGDATVENHDFAVTGEGVAVDAYFTVKGLKNANGISKETVDFPWMNSYGSTGLSTIEGATVENILKDVVGLKGQTTNVTFICADGKTVTMTYAEATTADMNGVKPMIGWKETVDGETTKPNPKLFIGQSDANDANKSRWLKDVVEIRVDARGITGGAESAEAADLVITGEGLDRDGYFTIKFLKNEMGFEKQKLTYNWMNSSGSTGSAEVEGHYLIDILKAIGVNEKAEKVTLISDDDRVTVLDYAELDALDLQGYKPMYAWKEDGNNCSKLIVGQYSADDKNKSKWAKNIVKIVVEPYTAEEVAENLIADIEGIEVSKDNLADSKAAVVAAREAYDALTDEQKAALGPEAEITLLEAELAVAEVENNKVADELEKVINVSSASAGPVKVDYTNVNNNRVTLKYTWKSVEDADGYLVQLYRNGKLLKTVDAKGTKATFTNFKRGYVYRLSVTPYIEYNGDDCYGKTANNTFKSRHGKASINIKKSGDYRVIKSGDRNSTGFIIYVSKDKNFKTYKSYRVVTNEKAMNKKVLTSQYFKKGTNYVKIKAYTQYNGTTVYGNQSNVLKVVR